jgi:hypothetical protein
MSVPDDASTDPHDELHHALLQWMRATKAAALYYVDKENKRRRISLRTGKGRWEIACRMIMRMIDEIDRLEAEDSRGAMVDTWRVPEPADPQAEAEARKAKETEEEERATPRELRAAVYIAKMVEDGRRQAVQEYMKGTRELFAFVMDGNKQTQARLETLERSYSGMIKTVFEAYKTRAEIEGFIAGGGLKQNQAPVDENERLIVLLLAKKFGIDTRGLIENGAAGLLEGVTGDDAEATTKGNEPTNPF